MASKYQRHLDAFHRIFDGAYPKSRPAHEAHERKRAAAEQSVNDVPDQSRVQDRESGPSDSNFNDVKMGWLRGEGLPPHFDSGPSGNRYK